MNNFTIEEIHAIRYENYEKTKNMTHEELLAHTRKEAAEGLELLKKMSDGRKLA